RELRQTEASDSCAALPRPNEYRPDEWPQLRLCQTLRWRHEPGANTGETRVRVDPYSRLGASL
ncbi:MAG: hypothetical protein R3C56_39125, partial [Pirellulaceae bacterium]